MSDKGKQRVITDRSKTREPFLAPDVTHIDYKDVTLLHRFISDKGKVRSRSITGITRTQQRMVAKAVKNAREMALLPYPPHGVHVGRGGRR
ncbi:MAG TPA: 30S ribosomal protein S18 [Acidimicrobiia bacterium]